MARINVLGEACVITSSLTLNDIKTIEKYRPKALTLYGGEDGKDPLFAICTANSGSINKNGASFNTETHDDAKLACLTVIIPAGVVTGNVREWVADQMGSAIISLNKLEETLPAILLEIKAEKEAVLSNISVQ